MSNKSSNKRLCFHVFLRLRAKNAVHTDVFGEFGVKNVKTTPEWRISGGGSAVEAAAGSAATRASQNGEGIAGLKGRPLPTNPVVTTNLRDLITYMHLAAARLKIIACICLYTMCSRLPAWYPSSHVLAMCLDCFLQAGQLCRCHLCFAGWWVKVWKNDGAADNRGWGRSGIRVVLGHVDAMLGYVDWGDVGAKLGSCWAMWRLCWASLGPRCSNYLLAGGDCVGDDIAITFDRDLGAYLRTTASSLVGHRSSVQQDLAYALWVPTPNTRGMATAMAEKAQEPGVLTSTDPELNFREAC